MGLLREAGRADQAGPWGSFQYGGERAGATGDVTLPAAAALLELLSSPAGQAAAAATVAAAERARLRQHAGPALDFGLPATVSAVPSALFLAQLLGQSPPSPVPAQPAANAADRRGPPEDVVRGTALATVGREQVASAHRPELRAELQESATRTYGRVADAVRTAVARRHALQLDADGNFVSAMWMVDILV